MIRSRSTTSRSESDTLAARSGQLRMVPSQWAQRLGIVWSSGGRGYTTAQVSQIHRCRFVVVGLQPLAGDAAPVAPAEVGPVLLDVDGAAGAVVAEDRPLDLGEVCPAGQSSAAVAIALTRRSRARAAASR